MELAGQGGVKPGTFRVIKVREGVIYQRVTLTDREVITTPYYYTVRFNSGGPTIVALAGSSWHEKWRADLAFLADLNSADASSLRRASSGASARGDAAPSAPARGLIGALFRRG